MILRALELGSLALFGTCSLAVSLIPESTEPFLQFGALGLVGFMVFQNYRQSRDKDKTISSQSERMARLIADDTDAKNRLAQVLEDRPCIAKDQRIKEK